MSTLNQSSAATPETKAAASKRLLSLDFLRGFIMVMLAMESTGIYGYIYDHTSQSPFVNVIFMELTHHPWHGIRFWDLVQPSFMFMAGVAMAFSLNKQWAGGMSWGESFRKTLKRCGWLFFWGVLDYAVRPGGLSFELWDVLTQLSFTTLLAFLVFRWSAQAQIIFCAGLLLLTEVLYRFTHVPGFGQPFTDQHNFGNYVDWLLMHKINNGGWVAINCIPTAVHTIGGAIVGKYLISSADKKNVLPVVIAGIGCLVLGFGMDMSGLTPIIKRIATSSFTLVSLGWALLFLALSYWWVDMKGHQKHLQFFTIVGMNSIFIYLFFEIVGDRWFTGYITFISNGVMGWFSAGDMLKAIVAAICVFSLEWGLCWFLYKRKIFFKL